MNNSQNIDDDTIWLILIGIAVFSSVGVAAFWARVTRFLVDRQVLVGDPVLAIPGAAGGAGLDLPRLAILAAAILGSLFLAVSVARRRWGQR